MGFDVLGMGIWSLAFGIEMGFEAKFGLEAGMGFEAKFGLEAGIELLKFFSRPVGPRPTYGRELLLGRCYLIDSTLRHM